MAGSFELMSKDPILVLDSAHNPDSALKLRLALDDYLNECRLSLFLVFLKTRISWACSIIDAEDQSGGRTQSTHPRAFAANNW